MTFSLTEACDLQAHCADNGVLCSAKGAGCWGGLCMENIGSERVKLSPSNNDRRPAYNRCIGTVAESPKQGMRTDDTRSWNQLRCDPHTWVTMAELTTCLAENGIRPLSITERDRRGIRALNAKLRTTDGRPCLAWNNQPVPCWVAGLRSKSGSPVWIICYRT